MSSGPCAGLLARLRASPRSIRVEGAGQQRRAGVFGVIRYFARLGRGFALPIDIINVSYVAIVFLYLVGCFSTKGVGLFLVKLCQLRLWLLFFSFF